MSQILPLFSGNGNWLTCRLPSFYSACSQDIQVCVGCVHDHMCAHVNMSVFAYFQAKFCYLKVEILEPLQLVLSTVVHCLMTGTHSEKCIIKWFHHCINIWMHVTKVMWCHLLLLGHKSAQHVIVLNAAANNIILSVCATVTSLNKEKVH